MKKQITKLILGSSIGLITTGLIILVPILMVLDFFGANITDDYVEGNMEYSTMYKEVLNKNITQNNNGYVSLNRILYFYLEDDSLTFEEIYNDNLDKELKQVLTIGEVCKINKYKNYGSCKNIDSSQIDEIQNKPFSSPVKLSDSTITSFFMEERVVFGNYNVHSAWDLALANQSKVYSVCDGIVTKVNFPYKENVTDTSGGGGNEITVECSIDEIKYLVSYAHLYPNSSKVNIGNKVSQGQEIASIGTTGYSTGPHLHFLVELDNKIIDGLSLIDFNKEINNYNQFDNVYR
ncbi:MAG: M23 family metallopeptidase [Bacilli bacterium]